MSSSSSHPRSSARSATPASTASASTAKPPTDKDSTVCWPSGTGLMPRAAPFPNPVDRLLALTGPRPRVAVAFSGGLDSTVLAHALVKGRRHFAYLRLLHVDHGLQQASADWAKQCARQARRWRV